MGSLLRIRHRIKQLVENRIEFPLKTMRRHVFQPFLRRIPLHEAVKPLLHPPEEHQSLRFLQSLVENREVHKRTLDQERVGPLPDGVREHGMELRRLLQAPHRQSSEIGILGIELREHDIVLGNAGVVDQTRIRNHHSNWIPDPTPKSSKFECRSKNACENLHRYILSADDIPTWRSKLHIQSGFSVKAQKTVCSKAFLDGPQKPPWERFREREAPRSVEKNGYTRNRAEGSANSVKTDEKDNTHYFGESCFRCPNHSSSVSNLLSGLPGCTDLSFFSIILLDLAPSASLKQQLRALRLLACTRTIKIAMHRNRQSALVFAHCFPLTQSLPSLTQPLQEARQRPSRLRKIQLRIS
nr:hypothetical protein Iba_chr05dCG18030 [Ipomoea batatas]